MKLVSSLWTVAYVVVVVDSIIMSNKKLYVGTRLHLGNSTVAPPDEIWKAKVNSFANFCTESCGPGTVGIIAVDATPKIPNYCLVDTIRKLTADTTTSAGLLEVLPVTPWGKFVPALNALIGYAASQSCAVDDRILFVSAETGAPTEAVQTLVSHMDHDTLVAGARLEGHDYRPRDGDDRAATVALTGRTSPWNTLAVWNLRKLALTGFQLVSDGLLTNDSTEPSYGIEEVVATCLLQKLLGQDHAKSKLVQLPGIHWDQEFETPERQKWHEFKMESKSIRAARQLELTGLSGVVHHC